MLRHLLLQSVQPPPGNYTLLPGRPKHKTDDGFRLFRFLGEACPDAPAGLTLYGIDISSCPSSVWASLPCQSRIDSGASVGADSGVPVDLSRALI
jgi:hypothetical protein